MPRFRGPLALAVLVCTAGVCFGQGLSLYDYGSTSYYGGGGLFAGINYTRVRGNSVLSISASTGPRAVLVPVGGPVIGPPVYYPAYYGPYGIRERYTSIRITPPPIIVVQPPLIGEPIPRRRLLPDDDEDLFPLPQARLNDPPPPAPLPGRDAGVFRPIDQDNRDRAARPVPLEPAPPPMEKPQPAPPPPEPPDMPRRGFVPVAAVNPRDEAARLVALGRDHFAAREYGRAAERFRQALRASPNEGQTQFLLAQALIALGKYSAAVDAVHEGMAILPDWPREKFQPLALYGDNVADYPAHLGRLEAALSRHADDPELLFLQAYALWLDGRRDDARPLFEKALRKPRDARVIQQFLQAMPPAPGAAL